MSSLFKDLRILLFYSKAEFICYTEAIVIFNLLPVLLLKFVVVDIVFLPITAFLRFSKILFSLSVNMAVFRGLPFVAVTFFGERIVKRGFSRIRLRSK